MPSSGADHFEPTRLPLHAHVGDDQFEGASRELTLSFRHGDRCLNVEMVQLEYGLQTQQHRRIVINQQNAPGHRVVAAGAHDAAERCYYSAVATFYVQNFGCRATQADGAALERQFEERGLERAAEPGVVFGSKAVGEPPLMLAISVREAIREAVAAFGQGGIVEMDTPSTPERIFFAIERARPRVLSPSRRNVEAIHL